MKLTHPKQDSLAKLLLEANASNIPDNHKPLGRTPLRWAIEKGHWRITWDICPLAELSGVMGAHLPVADLTCPSLLSPCFPLSGLILGFLRHPASKTA